MGSTHVRKNAYVHVLYVGTRNGKRDKVFRFTGSSAGMATDAACVIDHLGPFDVSYLGLRHERSSFPPVFGEVRLYHARRKTEESANRRPFRL